MPKNGDLSVGIDLVRVSRIEESMSRFGARFLRRVFTEDEIAYATSSPSACAERLAARFAAKEAALKALKLADGGIPWTDLEVKRDASGQCELELHGSARRAVDERGSLSIALSLSHEDDYATAIVIVARND